MSSPTQRACSIAGLGTHRRAALTLRATGYSYREIEQLLGVTHTWVNHHVTSPPPRRRARRSPTSRYREHHAFLGLAGFYSAADQPGHRRRTSSGCISAGLGLSFLHGTSPQTT